MILKFDEIPMVHLPEFKGGEKELAANMFFDGTNRIFRGSLVPGASIGFHTHEDSCEVIHVVSGEGLLLEDGKENKVIPGDCLYCPKGCSHSLMNPADSAEDLIFLATVCQC